MYIEQEEKTGLEKTLIALNAACATIFRVSGKTLKFVVRILAGEPNQNNRGTKEVNS